VADHVAEVVGGLDRKPVEIGAAFKQQRKNPSPPRSSKSRDAGTRW
jgi:hypothetical protein